MCLAISSQRLPPMRLTGWMDDWVPFVAAGSGVAGLTLAYARCVPMANATTVALSYVLVVLFVAAWSRLWIAIAASVAAMVALNYFFLPPVHSLAIADPQNLVAWVAFLGVSLMASRLSSVARERHRQAVDRSDQLSQLFDLSRDVLLTTDGPDALPMLAAHIARRFRLDYVAIWLPTETDFMRYEAGRLNPDLEVDTADLLRALDAAERGLRVDMGGLDAAEIGEAAATLRLAPLRLGARAIGLLGVAGRRVEPHTLDTLGSLVAIAVERGHFLEERRHAEVTQRIAEFKSALLASVAHDLRTPLTALRVAADNLCASWLDESQRQEQADIVISEAEHLAQLFQNILEMARIDAGVVASEGRWVHPAEIAEAARSQVKGALREHRIEVAGVDDRLVHLDPRLTSTALAHLLENAARYSEPQSTIRVGYQLTDEGLLMTVQDEGMGIDPQEAPHLFERFYRGKDADAVPGTGMGLAITKGLLAAERGRVWVENRVSGGAQFSILVPAESRLAGAVLD
jgi:two-component system, OmpR family, sensor histidine kinase KdpD